MQPTSVLYVEDEENDVLLVQVAFKRAAVTARLMVVRSGREALEYLGGSGRYADREQYPIPVLMLLDLNLPDLTGLDVLKWLQSRSAPPKPPVIVFSSSSNTKDVELARELGAEEFFTKPVNMVDFVQTIDQVKRRWLSAPEISSRERLNQPHGP